MSFAPDYIEPRLAWRIWKAEEREGFVYLGSLFHQSLWPVQEPLVAQCNGWRAPWRRRRSQRHSAPKWSCQCGIYASSLRHLDRHYLRTRIPREGITILGRVSLWGEVVECEWGWRASHAYPERLFVPQPPRDAALAEWIAKSLEGYGVPVEIVEATSSRALIAELGASYALA